jgi:RHS repeat-associated protein
MGCRKLSYYQTPELTELKAVGNKTKLTPINTPTKARREYLYGFNGKEKDDEIKGEGNSLDFGARIYDPRLGRFLSRDRFENKFPHQSPYVFAENSPISFQDINGDSAYYSVTYRDDDIPLLTITVTGSVINLSNDKIDVHGLASEINAESKDLTMFGQTVSDFTYRNAEGERVTEDVEVQLSFKFKGVNKFSEIKASDHAIYVSTFNLFRNIEGEFNPIANGIAGHGDMSAYIRSGLGSGWRAATTALHEIISHNLALGHDGWKFSITHGDGLTALSGNIKDSQLQDIVNNIDADGVVNKEGTQTLGKKPSRAPRGGLGKVVDMKTTYRNAAFK